MNRTRVLVLVVCLLGYLQAYPAFACRYNVRETGFVDLGIEPYFLYCYVSQETRPDIVPSVREISDALLMESNIGVEVIDVNQQKDHPAIEYLDVWSIQSFPAAVLVSPDGQSLQVPIAEPDRPFKQTLSSALDSILTSPKRTEISQQVSKTYGVVLLIEGTDAQETEQAKEAAAAAIEQIRSEMEWLPKPVAHPPVVVIVEQQSLAKEKILLWSLGLDAEEIDKPHAAILYGRARWMGPMFVGQQITEENLAAVLFVIGADCECGFDYRWLQGTMLPARWDQQLQAVAAESLGFDPENPMIKMEISWIIRRGYPYYSGAPLSYHELVVDDEPVAEAQHQPAVPAPNTASPSALSPISGQAILAEGDSPFAWLLFAIAGLSLLVISVGLMIVLRQARKNV